MKILIGTQIVDLTTTPYMRLMDQKSFVKRLLDQNPDQRETLLYKIKLINDEIKKRDLAPIKKRYVRNFLGNE